MNLKTPLHIKDIKINLNNFSEEIILNKVITTASPSNLYEILYECDNFNFVTNLVLQHISHNTNEKFDCYVKSLYGYVHDSFDNDKISFNKNQLKEGLILPPKYSFIFVVESEMNIYLNCENVPKVIDVKTGEMLIFNTKDFLGDYSNDVLRLALIGSISNNNVIFNKKQFI